MDPGGRRPWRCVLPIAAVLFVGVLLGTAVVIGAVVHAWRGQWVPPWLPTAGFLVILVAARRSFNGVTETTAPETWASLLEQAWYVGAWSVGLGVLMAISGVLGPTGARRSPALVSVGMIVVATSLVWASWTHGEAQLWRAWDAPRVVLEGVRAAAEQRLRNTFFWTAVGLTLVGVPASVWAFLRGRWVGLGEAVAAGMLVTIVLGTGQPARKAVQEAAAPWLAHCDAVANAGVGRRPGDTPWDGRTLVRVGPTGPEVFDGRRWTDEPWPEDAPIAVVAPASVPPDRLTAWVAGREDVVVAGWAPPEDTPRLFTRHPVVVASRCHATRWGVEAEEDAVLSGMGQPAASR